MRKIIRKITEVFYGRIQTAFKKKQQNQIRSFFFGDRSKLFDAWTGSGCH